MKIAVDIDEVLGEWVRSYILYVNKQYGYSITFEDIYVYRLWELLNITKEQAFKYADEMHEVIGYHNIDLVEGAKEGIEKLRKEHEIFYITARRPIHREAIEIFLKKHFFLDNNLILSGDIYQNGKTKLDICRELEIKLILEDNGEYALKYAEAGLKVILFNKPWNINYSHKNLIRVMNWKEALVKIKGIADGQN